MITKEAFKSLSSDQQWELFNDLQVTVKRFQDQVTTLSAQVKELTLQLSLSKTVKATSKNSSKPPSQDFKSNGFDSQKEGLNGPRLKSIGRPGFNRELSTNPDQIIENYPEQCDQCGHSLIGHESVDVHEYDKMQLQITSLTTRVKLHACCCANCGAKQKAKAAEELEPGSPFGPDITSILMYFRYKNYMSFERMESMMKDVFHIDISQGAIAQILKRACPLFKGITDAFKVQLQSSHQINSDETSARLNKSNHWLWVFIGDKVTYYCVASSRSSSVVEDVLNGHIPQVWGSDLFSAQRDHGVERQVCLAHQLRDCQRAIDEGDTTAAIIKDLFQRAIQSHKTQKNIEKRLADKLDYESDLDAVVAAWAPTTAMAIKLKNRYTKEYNCWFTFLKALHIEPTNNESERALRTGVIFRKVTHCYRSNWGKDLHAYTLSVLETGRRCSIGALDAIRSVVDPLFLGPKIPEFLTA